jgi:hypothetical protein
MRSPANRRPLRQLAFLVVASLVLTAGSCDDDEPTGPASAAGTYVLASIQEQGSAECTIGTTGCTLNNTGTDVIVIGDGTLELLANGTFALSVDVTTNGVDDVEGAAGTWVRTQTGVTLTVTGVPVSLTGTFSSAAATELVFVLPANLFSQAASGNVTITFEKQ